MSDDLMNNDEEARRMVEIAAERQAKEKQLYEAALAKRIRDQVKFEEESKLVSESEKQYAKIRKEQEKQIPHGVLAAYRPLVPADGTVLDVVQRGPLHAKPAV